MCLIGVWSLIYQRAEDRKRIAREVRTAARKEKKLAKADAKRQRKVNAVMNRRMTKNPEKYNKNKERNKIRAMDAERAKVRLAAVHQAERLAAKYDPSGKMFNVGEVVVLQDGTVKSKKAQAIAQGRRARREAEKAANELEAQQATPGAATQEKPKKGPQTKRQQAKQENLAPQPTPPRPVVPEGISVPEGEADFIAMWDITDEEIQKRLSNEKRVKSLARKNLRRQQKEQKRFSQAMKLLKKKTENLGEKWDKEKGRMIVLKMQEEAEPEQESETSNSDSDSSAGGEDVKEVGQPDELPKAKKEPKKSKKTKEDGHPLSHVEAVVEPAAPLPDQPKMEKKNKRPAEDASVEEPKSKKKSKKSKKSDEKEIEAVETPAAGQLEAPLEKQQGKQPAQEENSQPSVEKKRKTKEEKAARKEDRKLKKQAKKEKNSRQYFLGEPSSKNEANKVEEPVEEKSDKKHKKHKSAVEEQSVTGSREAAQWNPDALTGDAARQEKFLRLLGAKKANVGTTDGAKHKSTAGAADIAKVQSDLERQYEAGMKMKHDGGGKRRGLGA